jgi:hypothetical protein
MDVDTRARGTELLDRPGQGIGRDAGTGADADAADISMADGFNGVDAFLDGSDRALGVRHECDAGVGEGDASAGPFEEALAELPLEGLNAGGDGRLGEEEGLGGAAEGAMARDLQEGFELSEFYISHC